VESFKSFEVWSHRVRGRCNGKDKGARVRAGACIRIDIMDEGYRGLGKSVQ
jgi:hypothetical protein